LSGRLGIDFGTSNTVVAAWEDSAGEGVPIDIPGYSRHVTYHTPDGLEERIAIIPSLIHYTVDGRRWIGNQILMQKLAESPQTFRWMKRYIARRSPVRINVNGRPVSHFAAGRDFLTAVLAFAVAQVHPTDEDVALAVPVEAFEHYETWLLEVAQETGLKRFRLIDEPTAAALGAGARLQPGEVFLIFDFGGGTLDAAIVRMDEPGSETGPRRCRVLGKAGTDLGGATIDAWLYEEILRQIGKSEGDELVRRFSRALLAECERAKEHLSFQDSVEVRVDTDADKSSLGGTITRKWLEEVFDRHEAYRHIAQTIQRALSASQERGYSDPDIRAVIMVGGSSLIPSVRQLLQRIFGRERVILRRPLDAVARGAAAFAAGMDFHDHIQHDYAIRYVDPERSDYAYRIIVRRGTLYPTRQPVARMTIKAAHDGQAELGLALFELGDRSALGDEAPLELIFDPQGSARLRRVTPEDMERRHQFWVNEEKPTFLRASPPAQRGEARFEVEFGIDGNKRLLITARDLHAKTVVLRDHPVIKLR
jgi:molecular chaperone DnaK (HSP70)